MITSASELNRALPYYIVRIIFSYNDTTATTLFNNRDIYIKIEDLCEELYDDNGTKTYTYEKVRVQMDTSNTFSRYKLCNVQIDIPHSRLASSKHGLSILQKSIENTIAPFIMCE